MCEQLSLKNIRLLGNVRIFAREYMNPSSIDEVFTDGYFPIIVEGEVMKINLGLFSYLSPVLAAIDPKSSEPPKMPGTLVNWQFLTTTMFINIHSQFCSPVGKHRMLLAELSKKNDMASYIMLLDFLQFPVDYIQNIFATYINTNRIDECKTDWSLLSSEYANYAICLLSQKYGYNKIALNIIKIHGLVDKCREIIMEPNEDIFVTDEQRQRQLTQFNEAVSY